MTLKEIEELKAAKESALGEMAEMRQALNLSRMHIKEWQEKYQALVNKVTVFPGRTGPGPKLIGFRVLLNGKIVGGPDCVVYSVLSAIDEMQKLDFVYRKCCVLGPVFDGDIASPIMAKDKL